MNTKKNITSLKSIDSFSSDTSSVCSGHYHFVNKYPLVDEVKDRISKIFKLLKDQDSDTIVTGKKIMSRFKRVGINIYFDQRLHEFRERFKNHGGERSAELNFQCFMFCIEKNYDFILKVFTQQLVIPDFQGLKNICQKIFEEAKEINEGETAKYIPPLAKVDGNKFGMTICSIDGQIATFGDCDEFFSAQSCVKPINYAIAVSEHGLDYVHRYVGREPSGLGFNELALKKVESYMYDDEDREKIYQGKNVRHAIPHNPMINAGAIMCCSLISKGQGLSAKLEKILKTWEKACGTKKINIDSRVSNDEEETAHRNKCLYYMMKEQNSFPQDIVVNEKTLKLYFDTCAIEVTATNMAVMAATFANGGINPYTHNVVFTPEAVRSSLSLMLSCGMYDFSGEWAFKIGLPAKSGVGGGIFCVIPGVCGICLWSPKLDPVGNSVRGIKVLEKLVKEYSVHIFDISFSNKINSYECDGEDMIVHKLLTASSRGNMGCIITCLSRGCYINSTDYDKRTALHIAVCCYQLDVVKFLLKHGAKTDIEDRWGHTPLWYVIDNVKKLKAQKKLNIEKMKILKSAAKCICFGFNDDEYKDKDIAVTQITDITPQYIVNSNTGLPDIVIKKCNPKDLQELVYLLNWKPENNVLDFSSLSQVDDSSYDNKDSEQCNSLKHLSRHQSKHSILSDHSTKSK